MRNDVQISQYRTMRRGCGGRCRAHLLERKVDECAVRKLIQEYVERFNAGTGKRLDNGKVK